MKKSTRKKFRYYSLLMRDLTRKKFRLPRKLKKILKKSNYIIPKWVEVSQQLHYSMLRRQYDKQYSNEFHFSIPRGHSKQFMQDLMKRYAELNKNYLRSLEKTGYDLMKQYAELNYYGHWGTVVNKEAPELEFKGLIDGELICQTLGITEPDFIMVNPQ